jgi:hypothetical protein
MTRRLLIAEKEARAERRWRIRHIQVISQFAKCNCGKIIPYGHVACDGHSTYGLKLSKADENTRCVDCGSDKTRVTKTKTGRIYNKWYIVEGKRFGKCIYRCRNCASRIWYHRNRIKYVAYIK